MHAPRAQSKAQQLLKDSESALKAEFSDSIVKEVLILRDQLVRPSRPEPSNSQNSEPTESKGFSQPITQQKASPSPTHSISLTQEERQTLIEKLRALSSMPGAELEKSERLYLEQQLSELLGFDVSTELENETIPFMSGRCRAMPHLKRGPTDTLSAHERVLEADLCHKRSQFGWLQHRGENRSIDETYALALSLNLFRQRPEQTLAETLEWYSKQRLLILNASELVAAVVSVADVIIDASKQYQCAASPELIRDAQLWSLENRGRVLCFFVTSTGDSIPTGMYPLT